MDKVSKIMRPSFYRQTCLLDNMRIYKEFICGLKRIVVNPICHSIKEWSLFHNSNSYFLVTQRCRAEIFKINY